MIEPTQNRDGGGTEIFLCRVDDIADGGSKGFVISKNESGSEGGANRPFMVLRRGQKVYVYVNRCPHNRAPLDFTPGKFLNHDGAYILCSNHGALFRIQDGFCVAGPCAGDRLKAVETIVKDGAVYLLDESLSDSRPWTQGQNSR